MSDQPATPEELKELFGDGFTDEYQAEAQERWGETDAWKQSADRTKRYTKADWAEVKAEMEETHAAFIRAKQAGEPATSEAAMDAAEAHRLHIHRRFYDLDHEFHRGLADMYIADPRFTKTYEDLEEGLAQYVRDAIHANADRHPVEVFGEGFEVRTREAPRRSDTSNGVWTRSGARTGPRVALAHASWSLRSDGSGRWGHAHPPRGA